jgi:competence protein ComEA
MEGKGLLRGAGILLALAVLKVGVDGWRDGGAPAPSGEDQLPTLIQEARDSRSGGSTPPAPLKEGDTLDPNRALAEDLVRIPGLKRNLAQALVAHRETHGPFNDAKDLLRVAGIGPVTLARMEPYLEFSRLSSGRRAERVEVAPRVDVNRAGGKELQTLPGIGPALAGRIVEYREKNGPFRVPEDLLNVRGIGPATLKRIQPLLRVR